MIVFPLLVLSSMRCSSLFPVISGDNKIVLAFSAYTSTANTRSKIYMLSQQLDFIDTSPCHDPRNSSCTQANDTNDVAAAAIFSSTSRRQNRSFVRTIRSHNLAGFVSHSDTDVGGDASTDERDVVISFDAGDSASCGNLIVITGETASGKSLFIVRALGILTGKITSSQKLTSYIQQSPTHTTDVYATKEDKFDTFVELEVILGNPHLSTLEKILQQQQIHYKHKHDSDLELQQVNEAKPRQHQFIFRRTLRMIPAKTNDTQRRRFRSVCTINGSVVSLRDFAMLTSPLFAIVDATTAISAILSNALTNGNGNSDLRRTSILDTVISRSQLWELHQAQQNYKNCRMIRLKYEKEMRCEQATLRLSNTDGNDKALDLLTHYIDELDSFAIRMTKFCRSLATSECDNEQLLSMPIVRIGIRLSQTNWSDSANDSSDLRKKYIKSMRSTTPTPYISIIYELLLEFRNEFKAVDDKHQVATQITATLGSLVTSNSAASAVHRARKMLTTMNVENDDTASSFSSFHHSTERLHELLNQVDQSLRACVTFLENDEEMGLLSILNRVRSYYSHVTLEHIDEMLNEWKSLSRKHSISPYLLPQCHENYKSERDGTNELHYKLLPRARSDEKIAYQQYLEAYQLVTQEREQVARKLSKSMTEYYLPRLGFTTSTKFTINIRRDYNTSSEYSSLAVIPPSFLVDRTDFLLSRTSNNFNDSSVLSNNDNFVHDVSSSGERARLLFAIECALPGSIGMACRSSPFTTGSTEVLETCDNAEKGLGHSITEKVNSIVQTETWYNFSSLKPIVTIYDEIDAHIGGRAVKAMTQLLVKQSITSDQQIIAITHNPTVAASASTHVIIQKKCPLKMVQREQFNSLTDMSHNPPKFTSPVFVANTTKWVPKNRHQQQQRVSVRVIRNDPYNEHRIQELVRMVGGSNDDDGIVTSLGNPQQNVEAINFVKSLIRAKSQNSDL